ncbi:rCG46103, partial [Rattus norvegicus]
MVPEMRGLSPGRRLPEPALCPATGGSPEPGAVGRRRHVLALPEEEAWRPQ